MDGVRTRETKGYDWMNIVYKAENYKYQTIERFYYQTSIYSLSEHKTRFIRLETMGLLTVFDGYAWDGASGPTIDTRNSMRAGLVHDALYQLMRAELLPQSRRKEVDWEFYQLLRKDGMSRLRAWIWYRAVRRLAKPFAQSDHRAQVYTAPTSVE